MPLALQRSIICLPDFSRLPVSVRDMLRQVDATVDEYLAVTRAGADTQFDHSLPLPTAVVPDIHHPLTSMFPSPPGPIVLDAARYEFEVLRRHAICLAQAVETGRADALIEACSQIAEVMTGEGSLRDRERCASPDRFGRYVVYPPPSQVGGQMAAIARSLQSSVDRPRAFDAMIMLVAITNCHPFNDGNGRISRILANWLLEDRKTDQCFYLPLREIAQFSRGGFIIRVRQAELYNDWLPLARFLRAAVKLWTAMVSLSAVDSPGVEPERLPCSTALSAVEPSRH